MTPVLSAFVLVNILELFLWLPPLWRFRKITFPLQLFLLGTACLVLLSYHASFGAVILAGIGLYRAVNLGRIIMDRMNPEHLYRVTWRTAWWLASYTLIILALSFLMHRYDVGPGGFWHIFLWLELAIALTLVISTLKHTQSMRPSKITAFLTDKELPTLTVCIPARNETEDLENCLRSLVASDYPKLEILALDDCSTNRRTPEIIRGFAHDGVRFIEGDPPKDGWLAKNQAYQKLLDEANGELILFCGADVEFEQQTLRNIVQLMLQKKKTMMSIMPRNILPKFLQLDASFIQPMRYAWEVAPPRKMFRRPPVLSTCWIAKRQVLLSAGGFSAVSRSIIPEGYFARHCVVHDGYGFRYSTDSLGLTSHKDVNDQRDTATRTKYPQLHRRPELVLVLTVAELFGIVMPFLFLAVGIMNPMLHLLLILSIINCSLLIFWYVLVCLLTYRQPDVRCLVSLPFATLLDVALLNYSMLKYEFSVVLWKDRNVCIPVMRVDPRLPDIEPKPSKA